MLQYSADLYDEVCDVSKSTARLPLKNFCLPLTEENGNAYLRASTKNDIENIEKSSLELFRVF